MTPPDGVMTEEDSMFADILVGVALGAFGFFVCFAGLRVFFLLRYRSSGSSPASISGQPEHAQSSTRASSAT
jgi:hypothetical protein